MIVKKNPESNLENFRGLFFKIGLISALILSFLAMEWQVSKSNGGKNYTLADADIVYEYLPPLTKTENEKPKPKQIMQTFSFSESENQEDPDPVDMEVLENTRIEISLPQETKQDETDFTYFPAISPEFPGGEEGLKRFIAQQLVYPSEAIEKQIEGKVFVRFIINTKGKVMDPRIVRSVDSLLDQEALRVVKSLPAWKPGMNNGKPLNVSYTVPITFRLQ